MSTEQNETRDESTIPAGEDATYFGSPRSVNSGEMLEPPDSPLPDSPDSLFSDESFKPDLSGPEPGEEPQYRGRMSRAVVSVAKAEAIGLAQPPVANGPPAPAPTLAPAPRRGGGNPTVAQAAPAYPAADAPPNPPQQD